MSILSNINSPADLRTLTSEELYQLAEQIRTSLVETVSTTGGHLAPNLGVVELTLGLHLALNLPTDKIVWDVGHQSYVHKLLTGRREEFSTLRQFGGLAGFPKRGESEYDVADTGHSSTSIGVALGLAMARDIQRQDGAVVAVIGDGALTGGPAYEALNHAGHQKTDVIVVLNDNEMSIDSNVGAISTYLERLRLDPHMRYMKRTFEQQVQRIPGIGQRLVQMEERFMDAVARLVVPGLFFEELGFKYIGPIDGHNIAAVVRDVRLAKETGGPVLIHCITKKGHGYKPAEDHPDKFHGTSPFVIATGEPKKAASPNQYTAVFGEALVELAERRPEIVGITAAMAAGTGLEEFAGKYPARFHDVGIAEGHAVTLASGLAAGGLRPVVAVYSTFLQRGYDQIIHDVALSRLPVLFAIDRAGLVGEDGPTHHGAFDMSYMSAIPGMTIMAPSDEQELRDMLFTAVDLPGPAAIRYPRGTGPGVERKAFERVEVGCSRTLRSSAAARVALVGIGRLVGQTVAAAEVLSAEGIECTVIDARFAKPIDEDALVSAGMRHDLVVTVEENVLPAGFGSSVASLYADKGVSTSLLRLGIPDAFVEHGPIDTLLALLRLDAAGIAGSVIEALNVIDSDASANDLNDDGTGADRLNVADLSVSR